MGRVHQNPDDTALLGQAPAARLLVRGAANPQGGTEWALATGGNVDAMGGYVGSEAAEEVSRSGIGRRGIWRVVRMSSFLHGV